METRQNAFGMFIGMIRTGISRFTIPFICGMIAVIYTFAVDLGNDLAMEGYLVLAVGIALSAMLQLVFEEKGTVKLVRLIEAGITFSVMGTLALLTILLDIDGFFGTLQIDKVYLYLVEAGIFMCSVLTGMIVVSTRGSEGSGTRAVFKGAFMSNVIAGVIFASLMIIYAAFITLIADLDEVWMIVCSVLSYASVGCLIFLSFLPRPGEESGRSKAYSVVTGFILLPLYLVLLTVLYIYLTGILIKWELPSGQLNPFGLVATGGFILLWLALKGENQPLANFFTRWGGLLLIPVIAAQTIGLAVRISAYGLTPLRVLSLACVVISVIAVFLCTFRAKIWVFFTVAVAIIMLLTLTPMNPVDISNWNQSERLENLLKKYEMLTEDGTIHAAKTDIAPEDYRAIKSSADYLSSGVGIKTPMMKIILKDKSLSWLRNAENAGEVDRISYYVENEGSIRLTGYDYAYQYSHYRSDKDSGFEWTDPKTEETLYFDVDHLIGLIKEACEKNGKVTGSKTSLTYQAFLSESERLIVIDERHAYYLSNADLDIDGGEESVYFNGWFLTKEP